MSQYASGTEVSVARSRAEIESIALKYGATRFGSMVEDGQAVIVFEAHNRRVKFQLPLPKMAEFEIAGEQRRRRRTPEQQRQAWEQACRQRWRALLLVIKAKLEAVEISITTFEEEFLAHIVLADGETVADKVLPQVEEAYAKGIGGVLLLTA